jgi:hypothetical protein
MQKILLQFLDCLQGQGIKKKKKNVFAAQRFCPYQACPKTKNFNRVYIFVPCSLTTFSEAVETLEFPLDARPSSERQRI